MLGTKTSEPDIINLKVLSNGYAACMFVLEGGTDNWQADTFRACGACNRAGMVISFGGVLIMSTKTKKVIAGIVAVILVLAMVVPMVLAGL